MLDIKSIIEKLWQVFPRCSPTVLFEEENSGLVDSMAMHCSNQKRFSAGSIALYLVRNMSLNISAHSDSVLSCEFSPKDGHLLVSGGEVCLRPLTLSFLNPFDNGIERNCV